MSEKLLLNQRVTITELVANRTLVDRLITARGHRGGDAALEVEGGERPAPDAPGVEPDEVLAQRQAERRPVAEDDLVIGAAPFFARLVETSLREVQPGVIEAAQAMGASTWQIVRRVLLPEARAGIAAAITVTAIALVGFTAMGGAIGAGGLGDLAYRYGYLSYKSDYMVVTVVLLILLVQALQVIGDRIVSRLSRH